MPYLIKCPTCSSMVEVSEMGFCCTNPTCSQCGVLKYSEFTAVDLLDILEMIIDELKQTASTENAKEVIADLRDVVALMEGEFYE